MASHGHRDTSADRASVFEIRLGGAVDPSQCEFLDDMTLSCDEVDDHRVTLLRVEIQDQAALAGLLDALLGLNTPVLSVKAVSNEETAHQGDADTP